MRCKPASQFAIILSSAKAHNGRCDKNLRPCGTLNFCENICFGPVTEESEKARHVAYVAKLPVKRITAALILSALRGRIGELVMCMVQKSGVDPVPW